MLTDTAVDPVSSRDLTLGNEWHLTPVSDQQAVEVLGTTCDLVRSAAAGRYKLSFLTLTEI